LSVVGDLAGELVVVQSARAWAGGAGAWAVAQFLVSRIAGPSPGPLGANGTRATAEKYSLYSNLKAAHSLLEEQRAPRHRALPQIPLTRN